MLHTNILQIPPNTAKSRYTIPSPQELKMLRRKKGYTQIKLAEQAGCSQSLIARIERGGVDPRVSTLSRILSVLNTQTAEDICTTDVIIMNQDNSVGNAIEIMKNTGISQLPIRSRTSNEIVGGITERLIMEHITTQGHESVNDKISMLKLEKIPIISSDLEILEIELLLLKNSALLVKLKHNSIGIITKSDLLQYYKV